jgi:FG-GAP-like repeat
MRTTLPWILFCLALTRLPASARAQDITYQHVVVDADYPKRVHCKTVGDINGDGRPDVLAASAAGDGLFWYDNPAWGKHRIDDGAFTTDMQVGDVDKDGDLDVIIPKSGVGLVWYENPRPQGDPAKDPWKTHRICPGGHHDVEIGDVNRDGKLDVVTRMRETRVLLQQDPDTWTRIVIPTGGRGGTALGDLDGDGDLDIAQNGYWLECPQHPVSAPWPRHEIAAGWPDDCGVAVADMNKDGRPDVLMAPAESKGRLIWYEATADPKKGGWIEHIIDADVDHIHTFKVVDMNRDGELDLVTAEMEQSPRKRVGIYWNLGKSLAWRLQVVGTSGSHNIRVADLNGDGVLDIIGANHGNHGVPTPVEAWLSRADHRKEHANEELALAPVVLLGRAGAGRRASSACVSTRRH